MSEPSIWSTIFSPEKAPCALEAGEVRIHLKVDERDWLVGVERERVDRAPRVDWNPEPASADTEWRRIGSVEELPEIPISPAWPDRPVVVRPEMKYSVLPGERVQFYVGVPVWLQLTGPNALVLMATPTVTLTNTWFGTPTDGELSYGMRTRARREGERLDFGPLRVVCPVRVRNHSKSPLEFERLCIRPRFLGLYEDRRRGLWANESSVIVRSDQTWSRVAYARSAPAGLEMPTQWRQGEEEGTGTHFLRAISAGRGWFQ